MVDLDSINFVLNFFNISKSSFSPQTLSLHHCKSVYLPTIFLTPRIFPTHSLCIPTYSFIFSRHSMYILHRFPTHPRTFPFNPPHFPFTPLIHSLHIRRTYPSHIPYTFLNPRHISSLSTIHSLHILHTFPPPRRLQCKLQFLTSKSYPTNHYLFCCAFFS